MSKKYMKVALCEGRHEIPEAEDGSIFSSIVDPTDVQGLEVIALCRLAGVAQLDLYVTGLTVALVAVLNVCHIEGIAVTLYHYNRETGDYYPQRVV